MGIPSLRLKHSVLESLTVLLFTTLGFLVMGYHPGLEDDGVYLSAVKANLNPALFPHDSEFFRVQMQATCFADWMAHFVQWTGIPLAWAELLWQFASLYFILWASKRIAARIFAEKHAQWAAVAMVAAMLTLPVAGTALTIADQHLHPRNMTTALILLAVSRIFEGKLRHAIPLLVLAFLLHPIMAVLGASFCVFFALSMKNAVPSRVPAWQNAAMAAPPLWWIFDPPSPSWRKALDAKDYLHLGRWAWYEWLGALAPLLLFWLLWRVARRHAATQLAQFALAVLAYGVFQQIVAVFLLTPESLIRFTSLQPMRYLQLVYLFMALTAGGLLGQFLLKSNAWRWAIYLLMLNGGMFLVQWANFDEGTHLEMPWTVNANPWLQTFDWIRTNTPADAYFALDPRYLAAPGEGFRSFRALAERSQLADAIKDTSVVTQVPSLASEWDQQQQAMDGWADFALADFQRLNRTFGVSWAVVSDPAPAGLVCLWHNGKLSVCRIP
jgi:hypothetical protein